MKTVKIPCLIVLVLFAFSCTSKVSNEKYEPAFESVETIDPVPEWFKDAKFGIYFHWGVYSVPAYGSEWYPRNMYFPDSRENRHHTSTYGNPQEWPYDYFISGVKDLNGNFVQFAPKLKSEGGNFDPAEWVQLFVDAGARFAGPVAEHHDGFSMWDSKVNPWNAKAMGPGIDLVKVLADEIRKQDMKLILSMHHAYNFTGYFEKVPQQTDEKLRMLYGQQGKDKNEALWLAKHKEIIDNFQPDIIWQDFNLPAISDTVLLQFLAYYYNRANDWGKEVVATYKDGYNTRCAVLDFERGGPTDLTQNYWLTDDAISSSSWCYTEGIGYYSKKQVLHGFLDRISKNGNLLLNLSPKADGTIPQEQREILLAMGDWLKKFGEAVYCTRAWEVYGEGPTKMGAHHGVFEQPKEGTSADIRYTRSKDKTKLYAILMGWDNDQQSVTLASLAAGAMDLSNLKEVRLIAADGTEGNVLNYLQNEEGLTIDLPAKPAEELAYVIQLSFDGEMAPLDKTVDLKTTVPYYLEPEGIPSPVVANDLNLTSNRRSVPSQWVFKEIDKGVYAIKTNADVPGFLSVNEKSVELVPEANTQEQKWKIETYFEGLLRITSVASKQVLIVANNELCLVDSDDDFPGWKLCEVCGQSPVAYKTHVIPGVIEIEDFDKGCPGDSYYDTDEVNSGGKYRPDEGVDIEVCSAGGYNTGWTKTGEWMTYTINVLEEGTYRLLVYGATTAATSKLHLEFDGVDKTGIIEFPNTGGYQNWEKVSASFQLEKGQHILKVVIDNANVGLNLDKLVVEAIKPE